MADKLNFSLVSPERELFSGAVDQVDVPGTEGDFAILPNHAPFMASIRTGAIIVKDGSEEQRFFVQGGFADVTPAGLTILAERCAPTSEISKSDLATEIEKAKADLETLTNERAMAKQQHLDGLEALFNMV